MMKQELEQAIAAAVKDLFGVEVRVELTRPDEQFGDYATNVALQLAGKVNNSPLLKLRTAGNPREIAKQLAVKLRENLKGQVKDISIAIAGPGFINLTLSDESLIRATHPKLAKRYEGQTIVTEYSDPNPFKPLHAGHLYTTLVGDSVSRLLEHSGAKVVRINYGGDVGLHVGKSMWGIIQRLGGESPEKLQDVPESERAQWLGECYVAGNEAYETDETKKQQIIEVNKRVYQLHEQADHASPFAQIYWTCRDWSYDYFKHLYEELQVQRFDRVLPESEVAPLGLQTVREQLKKGVYEESDGAVVFRGDEHGLHTRVFINSQGLPTYEAKEVGLLLTKWRDYHFDKSVIITANEQAQYMTVVIKSVAQFEPEPAKRSLHLTHGIVKLQGGTKMSSRHGNIVGALDILESAAAANKELTGQDNHEAVLGAVKYAFLKNRIGGDIIYDPKESVSLEGNSGPYLQYAHARARSILGKAQTPRHSEAPAEESQILRFAQDDETLEPDERSLVRKIGEYSEVVDKAVAELMPHHICTYLYELAQKFNSFYEHNRVIGDPREQLRLSLVKIYADTLKNGLGLLGTAAPEKM